MFLLKQILPAAVTAMLVAAGVCGVALFWRNERARNALVPLGLGLAYAAGHLLIVGWVSFPPTDTTNWLPGFALAAAILGACYAVLPSKAWARLLLFALVSGGALRLLLRPKFQYSWSLSEGWIWVACLAAAIVLLAITLEALGRRPAMAVELVVFLLMICAGSFGALIISGSILLGQFAAVLGAAVFGCLVYVIQKTALSRGMVPVFSLLLVTLLVSGHFFAELPAISAALIAFAPLFGLVPLRGLRSLAFPVRAILVSVPILIALVLTLRSSPPLLY